MDPSQQKTNRDLRDVVRLETKEETKGGTLEVMKPDTKSLIHKNVCVQSKDQIKKSENKDGKILHKQTKPPVKEKVESLLKQHENDMLELENETNEKMKLFSELLQGASLIPSPEAGPQASSEPQAQHNEGQELVTLVDKNRELMNEIKNKRKVLERLVHEQDSLREKVSSKSNGLVDIRPGMTVEGVYVSLRRRGKLLRGQKNQEAPILTAKEKVLLLPERSVRIMKEFLVGLKDKKNPQIEQISIENKALKAQGDQLIKKIMEQHESDKLHGSIDENALKQELQQYYDSLTTSLEEIVKSNQEIDSLTTELGETRDRFTAKEKDGCHLLLQYLEIRRLLNKSNQECNNLRAFSEGSSELFSQRRRKKQRVLENQAKTIENIQKEIEEWSCKNAKLEQEVNGKEAQLSQLQDNIQSLGVQELDSNIDANIETYKRKLASHREIQEELEAFPQKWDGDFKDFVQEMTTCLKDSLNDHPSNKEFPAIKQDWVDKTKEISDLEKSISMLERSLEAHKIKTKIASELSSEIQRVKERLEDGINEDTYNNLVQESRDKLEDLILQIKTIITDVKKDTLLCSKCKDAGSLSNKNLSKCPECQDLSKIRARNATLQAEISQKQAENQAKTDALLEKDQYIASLKEEIEMLEKAYSNTSSFMDADKELEFLMADQIEASLVPISQLNEPGYYLFGTKKIYVKVLEHELMVRVGGGFVDFDEYLVRYTDPELIKIEKQLKKERVKNYEDLEIYQDLVAKTHSKCKSKERMFVPKIERQ
ncbi:unnamed protein product [Moneuplotes crassus]|uniref:GAR domain-containing protein n=1 Tax=Euplotes crassus TaxID=5936 RepID=A0AAD1Y8Z0_EUPCR|nr:unnamed protein product [Moneuplotes crassus]